MPIKWMKCRKCGKDGITDDCGCPEPLNPPPADPPKRRKDDKK